MSRLNISVIIVFRNEAEHLARCLPRLGWCDEIIAVDMASTDNSAEVARQYAHRLLETEVHPAVEPTRVQAIDLTKHDWVLMIDPDEYLPESLATDIAEAMQAHPDAGAFDLPMWFYIKNKRVNGGYWGRLVMKPRLIHRRRYQLSPGVHRKGGPRPGYEVVPVAHDGDNHIRHYWCDSYRELLYKHLVRYPAAEAKVLAGEGERSSLRQVVAEPLREGYRAMRHYDGWRDGVRGWLLGATWMSYVALRRAMLLRYQGRVQSSDTGASSDLPQLREPLRQAA
ncbi:MAG: glycosyltransferase [Phycisphaeraceae bacterium]